MANVSQWYALTALDIERNHIFSETNEDRHSALRTRMASGVSHWQAARVNLRTNSVSTPARSLATTTSNSASTIVSKTSLA